MLEIIINIIIFCVMPISGFLVLKNILNIKKVNNRFKSIILILSLIAINFIQYNSSYQTLNVILNFISMVVCYKLIFDVSFFDSFLLSIVLMIFVSISDILTYLVMTPFFGMEAIRETGFIMLASNLMVGLFTVLLSCFNFIKRIINKVLSKLESKHKFQVISIAFLWVVVISCLCYFVVHKSTNIMEFHISALIEIIFIVFLVIYFREKNQNSLLNEKFNDLFDYIQTIEDIVESEQLNIHEYKNQLTVIKGMSKDKNINNYINSIVVNNDIDMNFNSDLKKLPKGGLKGLLYYKSAVAKKKNLNLIIDINKNSCQVLKTMSIENVKTLSKLLGVYLDNAIEASEISDAKNLSIEIYNKSDKVNIVISNSTIKNIDISKFNKKDYSTKGNSRGKGLYLLTNKVKNRYFSDFFSPYF